MIRGERVVLRPVEELDHPLIQRWQNDPEVWWLMDHERPTSLGDVAESERRAREEGYPYIIELDGRPIGKIGLNDVRRRDRICRPYVFIGEPRPGGRSAHRRDRRAPRPPSRRRVGPTGRARTADGSTPS